MKHDIKVNTRFDAGSIKVIDTKDKNNLQFAIRKDTNSNFAQWFYFQLSNVKDQDITVNINGLKTSAYPDSWENYKVCASYDNQYWFRLPTTVSEDKLTINFTCESNSIYFAYFEPYPYQRHLDLIGDANLSLAVTHEVIGSTCEGRNIDLLALGNPNAKNIIWITARQHPGESMAEWFMEGLIYRLLDDQDSISRNLLNECKFYLVPNMNPDGAVHGNLRVNAQGANLNREWLTPTLEKSPEVFHVRQKMLETGCSMFFDIHGDEKIPYIFTAGCEDNPSYSNKQRKLQGLFDNYFQIISPDYQTKHGYEKGQFNKDTPTLATNWVGNQFDCLALTIEMPFKDNDNFPDEVKGWDGNRSSLIGESLLTVINLLLNEEKLKQV